ncbi:MAG: hypothetical protein ACPLXL_02200 [Minisyncoccia bacterium]
MQKTHLFLKIFSFFALCLFTFTPFTLAQTEPPVNFANATPSTIDIWGSQSPLVRAVNWFFNIVIILCIIFIIYAGFTYVTSGGDPGKTKKALQLLIYALIGLAVAILSKALIKLVATQFIGAPEIQLPEGL